MAKKKRPNSVINWSPQARQCYELQGDCARCDVPELIASLETVEDCQIISLLPVILDAHGPPSDKKKRPRR